MTREPERGTKGGEAETGLDAQERGEKIGSPSAGDHETPGLDQVREVQPTPVTLVRTLPPWADDDIPERSFLEVADMLLKRWKLVVGLPWAAALVATTISLLTPPHYTAITSFIPESGTEGIRLPGGLAGLALQFGIGLSGNPNSPEFYTDILESRTLRDQALRARLEDPYTEMPNDSATLLDILKIDGDSETERLERGRKEMVRRVSINVANETGIVHVSVKTRYPALSADVANLLVGLLNQFNLKTRQTEGRERRLFIEGRLSAAGVELRNAEETLGGFLEQNRLFQDSPQLSFDYERLQRQVRIKEQVFTTLRQQYEEARIQEVDDTPLITVIDRAVPPEEKSSRRSRFVIIVSLLGGILAVFIAFGREYVERTKQRNEQAVQDLARRWATIKGEFRSVLARGGRSEEP